MAGDLLSAEEAARRLGVKRTTLYDWLGMSRTGSLVIRGQPVSVDFFQSGSKGQGSIKIESSEVDRIKELMRVRPRHVPQRRPPVHRDNFPGITVPLGRPDRER